MEKNMTEQFIKYSDIQKNHAKKYIEDQKQ